MLVQADLQISDFPFLYESGLIIASVAVTILFQKLIPFEWEFFRTGKRKKRQKAIEWCDDTQSNLRLLHQGLRRGARGPSKDWTYLSDELDTLSRRLARNADSAPDLVSDNSRNFIGSVAIDCTDVSRLCADASSGSYLELIHHWLSEIEGNDEQPTFEQILSLMQQHEISISEGHLPALDVEDVSEPELFLDAMEDVEEKVGSGDIESSGISIADPAVIALLMSVDEGLFNNIAEVAVSEVLEKLLNEKISLCFRMIEDEREALG